MRTWLPAGMPEAVEGKEQREREERLGEVWREAFAWADANRDTDSAIRYANYYISVVRRIPDEDNWPDWKAVHVPH